MACGSSAAPVASTSAPDAGPCRCTTGVCCAEEAAGHLATSCRASCITDTPRAKVCSGASDCEPTQTCKAYACSDLDYDGLRTCTPIRACP